jgi:hypothetical protein
MPLYETESGRNTSGQRFQTSLLLGAIGTLRIRAFASLGKRCRSSGKS